MIFIQLYFYCNIWRVDIIIEIQVDLGDYCKMNSKSDKSVR